MKSTAAPSAKRENRRGETTMTIWFWRELGLGATRGAATPHRTGGINQQHTAQQPHAALLRSNITGGGKVLAAGDGLQVLDTPPCLHPPTPVKQNDMNIILRDIEKTKQHLYPCREQKPQHRNNRTQNKTKTLKIKILITNNCTRTVNQRT
eukprot:gene6503-4685_t